MADSTRSKGWHPAIGILVGVTVFVALPESARWLHGGAFGQTPTTPQAPSIINGNCNFPGGTNNGSINCNNSYNNIPAPELKYQRTSIEKEDGGYRVEIWANLISPFSPAKIFFEIHAPKIKNAAPSPIDIIPQNAGGVVLMGFSGTKDGLAFTSINNPQPGSVLIRFRTEEDPAGKITIYYSF
jgi:hypothetical protein